MKHSISLKAIPLKYMDLNNVRKMILETKIKKPDLIEIGFERFGASKSMMRAMNKESLKEFILSLASNEETLYIIGKQARDVANNRTS